MRDLVCDTVRSCNEAARRRSSFCYERPGFHLQLKQHGRPAPTSKPFCV